MEQDYSQLVANLKKRRYDEALREPVLSDSFNESGYPNSLLYVLESMVEIDVAYAYKVYANSRKIHEMISKSLKRKGYDADYRYQGALKTYSNILLYGDVEIMVIKKNVSNKPHTDIQTLAKDLLEVLSKDPTFSSVDYRDKTRIRIIATKPTCEIDILPTLWVDTSEYKKTHNEIYRGIAEFDFKNKKVKKYLPFLNIARVNAKDQQTNGNLKALSRLLKTLKTDAKDSINLKDSEIHAMVYSIPKEQLAIPSSKVLSLLPTLYKTLNKLATDNSSFTRLVSPSEKDRVFGGRPEKQNEIKKLSHSLAILIKKLEADLSAIDKSLTSEIAYL